MNTQELQVVASLFIVIMLFVSRYLSVRMIKKIAESNNYAYGRTYYTRRIANMILYAVALLLLAIVWDVSFRGLSVYFASVFTILGVAFFASWSILSNISSSLVLFFNHPFKIGDRIRVQDGDNSVEGMVEDINLFNIRIRTDEQTLLSYPNNLALQKPIYKLSEEE